MRQEIISLSLMWEIMEILWSMPQVPLHYFLVYLFQLLPFFVPFFGTGIDSNYSNSVSDWWTLSKQKQLLTLLSIQAVLPSQCWLKNLFQRRLGDHSECRGRFRQKPSSPALLLLAAVCVRGSTFCVCCAYISRPWWRSPTSKNWLATCYRSIFWKLKIVQVTIFLAFYLHII